jgi:hypothetical protein
MELTTRGEALAYVVLIALLFAASYLIPDGVISRDLVLEADARAKTVLDLILDLQQFTGVLNTALFTACGFLDDLGSRNKVPLAKR